MRRLRVLIVTAALLGLVPGAAGAQGRVVERSSQSLRVQGAVEVEFAGTAQAGCAAAGVCGVGGSVSYVPGGRGQLFLATFRNAKGALRRTAQAFSFGFGPGSAPQTVATTLRDQVQCVDARGVDGGSFDVRVDGDDIRLSLAPGSQFGFFGGDPLRTRCAGPLAADVFSALPARRISRASLAAGRTVDFGGERPFSAGGFSGTVRSSVRFVFERARRQQIRRGNTRRRRSAPRRASTSRRVRVPLRLVSVSGDATLDFAGDPATCRRLDACGVTGATTITPRPRPRPVFFFLSVRSRSRPAALAAVGQGSARPARLGFGGGGTGFDADAGRSSTTLTRVGVASCTARADGLRGGSLDLEVLRATRRLRVRLSGAGLGVSRCPGPLASDLDSGNRGPALASGSIALSALGARRVTIPLTEGSALVGPGYRGAIRSRLSVTLERGAVTLGP